MKVKSKTSCVLSNVSFRLWCKELNKKKHWETETKVNYSTIDSKTINKGGGGWEYITELLWIDYHQTLTRRDNRRHKNF